MAKDMHPTRERILDAAEELFAHHGFEGVSIRQIMTKAEADVSLAYYHFESKRDLFDQVMLRRVEYLNEIRLKALAEDHDKWSHYYQLIAQINNSPERGGELMSRYFDPLVSRFIDALKRALPDSDPVDLYWSYHFLSGALTLTFAETGRIDNLSGGVCKSTDVASVIDRMPAFLAAGFRELCNR